MKTIYQITLPEDKGRVYYERDTETGVFTLQTASRQTVCLTPHERADFEHTAKLLGINVTAVAQSE